MISGRSLVTYAIIRRACARARDVTRVITDKHTLLDALFHCLNTLLYFLLILWKWSALDIWHFAHSQVKVCVRARVCVRACVRVRVLSKWCWARGEELFSRMNTPGVPPLDPPTYPPTFLCLNCSKERMKMWNRPVRACALVKQVTTVNFSTD